MEKKIVTLSESEVKEADDSPASSCSRSWSSSCPGPVPAWAVTVGFFDVVLLHDHKENGVILKKGKVWKNIKLTGDGFYHIPEGYGMSFELTDKDLMQIKL